MTTRTTLTHDSYCHCGKWAKFHVAGDEGCGNVCGIHARRFTDKTDRAQSICDSCGGHASGGRTTYHLTTNEPSTFTCGPCVDKERGR